MSLITSEEDTIQITFLLFLLHEMYYQISSANGHHLCSGFDVLMLEMTSPGNEGVGSCGVLSIFTLFGIRNADPELETIISTLDYRAK